jgi:PAS domain S-box-containing protein
VEAATLGIWDWDIADDQLEWSPRCYEIFGVPPGTRITYERFLQALHVDDRRCIDAAVKAALERREPYDVEMRAAWPDGTLHWINARGRAYFDESGRAIRMSGTALDITEHKRAEAERLLLASAIEQAAESVVITDRDARIQYVNPAFTRVTGYTRKEALNQNPRLLKSGEHDARFYQELWVTLSTGQLWRGEFTNRRKDGTLYTEEATIAPVRNAAGEITNYIAIKSDITERRRKEIALRESEMMLRFFVQHAPAAIAMLDREMHYLVVSKRWMADYHLEDQDIRGLSHYEVFPEISERWKEIHQRCMDGAVERREEDPFPRADGGIDWVRWEVRPWQRFDASIGGIIIFSEVITERKRAEDALKWSEYLLRESQRVGRIGSYELDVATGRISTSPITDEIFGIAEDYPKDVSGWKALVHPSEREETEAYLRNIIAEKKPFERDYRITRPSDGAERWVSGKGELVQDGQSRQLKLIGTIQDITERKRAADELREHIEELETVMDVAPVAIWVAHDAQCQEITGNRMADRIYEAGAGENVSANITAARRFFAEGRELPAQELPMQQAAARGVEIRNAELEVLLPSGRPLFMIGNASPLWDAAGRMRGSIGAFLDVTERRQTEQALEESELRYRQLFEQSESAVGVYEMVYDTQGNACDYRYVNLNPAFERLTGWAPSQILGRTAREITPDIEDYWINLFSRVAETGKPTSFEHYARHLGRYYSGTAYSPRAHQVAVTFTDVTERKKAEQALQQLNIELEERVRARTAALEASNRELDAFAHSVSHDLRGPLRGIDGWSLALLEDYGERLDAQARKYLERVRSEAQHMGRLIDDLLHLSRVSQAELIPQPVDLSALAESIVARLKEAHRDRRINFMVAPNMQGTGDPRLLEVALTNLLENAVKFTATRPLACVEMGEAEYEGKPAFFVRDNGVGFDMAYAGMLFQPFQRLHKPAEFPGTGIGLATVQRVIHRHGGRVWAEAQVGAGATMYFTLGDHNV